MDKQSGIGRNLCFLLWHGKVAKERWPQEISRWAGCSDARAMELLVLGLPTASELDRLAAHFGYSQEDLRYQDLTAGVHVLQENLRFLIDDLTHGNKGELAAHVGVARGTVTGWLNGKTPSHANRQKITSFFRLGNTYDLEVDPLFLDPYPIREMEQRAWLEKRIAELDRQTLRELFPALRRLFKDR